MSNPPYISQNSLDIQKDVYDYEPHLALFSKNNGIEAYNKIISNLASRIDKNFFLFLEIGLGQASEVTKLLKNNGFTEILTKVDLANIPRCVIAKKIIN